MGADADELVDSVRQVGPFWKSPADAVVVHEPANNPLVILCLWRALRTRQKYEHNKQFHQIWPFRKSSVNLVVEQSPSTY